MSYYPKSQIKTNLSTNFINNSPQYFIFSSQTPYQGNYYETSSGKKYTGNFPGDGNNLLLIESLPPQLEQRDPLIDTGSEFINSQIIFPIQSINKSDLGIRSVPQYYTPFPTPQETQQGSIIRYFCKKGNEYRYIEINKETYNKLFSQDKTVAWDLYTPISLQWSTVSNTSSPPTSYFENQLGWVGFSRYVKPLKTPTTIQPK
jgi:hypothetical protein